MSLCDLFLHKNIIYALKDSIDGFFCTKSKMEAEIIQKIWDVIDIETAELPSRVLDLEWIMAEKILRVYIENTDGTQVEMDHCVAFTRQIKDNEAIDGLVTAPTYQLEVSSPGVEKPLRKPEHFSDVKDQMVFVQFKEKTDGRRKIRGTVVGVSDSVVSVDLEEGGQFSFDTSAIKKANLVYDWDR